MIKKILLLVIFISSIFFNQSAYAYLDPGTGSAIMGLIVSFFVAIGVIFKTFWYRIKSFFTKNKNTKIIHKDK
tara:strand:- start:352 stop:570 length:219 start_codon:yes stop_codon:yes gene_type:complete